VTGTVEIYTETDEISAMVKMKITKRLGEKRPVSLHKITFSLDGAL
jgi:hypothetical protein